MRLVTGTGSTGQSPSSRTVVRCRGTKPMAEFRDATGRPGPSTWELGTYADGQDDYPVHGVGWYEAAAFARYAGQMLPTVHHWRRAAGFGVFSDILELSNFLGKGPAKVGEFKGIGPYGKPTTWP